MTGPRYSLDQGARRLSRNGHLSCSSDFYAFAVDRYGGEAAVTPGCVLATTLSDKPPPYLKNDTLSLSKRIVSVHWSVQWAVLYLK